MAFAKKKASPPRISAGRLAAVAGANSFETDAAESAAPSPRRTIEPDLSRMRPRGLMETPEQQKKRRAAKTVNFTMTFAVRLVIMAALGYLLLGVYEGTGAMHRGYLIAMFVVAADFVRVTLKAIEPGTR